MLTSPQSLQPELMHQTLHPEPDILGLGLGEPEP